MLAWQLAVLGDLEDCRPSAKVSRNGKSVGRALEP